jgi:hypothetical protein
MKIAVVGKGAACLGVISALQNSQTKIDQVDIFTKNQVSAKKKKIFSNVEINSFFKSIDSSSMIPSKINIQEQISDNQDLFRESYDPMMLWGTSFLPFPRNELQSLNINEKKIYNSYREIAKIIPIAGVNNDNIEKYLETFPNNIHPTVDNNFEYIVNLLNKKDENRFKFISGKSRLALKNNEINKINTKCSCIINNCEKHDLYLANDIDQYINESNLNFRIISSSVDHIDFKEKKVSFCNQNKKEQIQRTYDLIFICTGAKETALLLKKSLNSENISVYESSSFIFPIIAINKNIFLSNDNSFTLTSAVSFIQDNAKNKENHFLQIYKSSEYIWMNFFPKFIWPLNKIFSFFLSKIIFFGVVYLDDKNSIKYNFYDRKNTKFKKIEKSDNKTKAKLIIKNFSKKLGKSFFALDLFTLTKKTSHHFAKVTVENNPLSKLNEHYKSQGIYFCGSSIFSRVPASSPTFTIIAHSHMIAEESLKER